MKEYKELARHVSPGMAGDKHIAISKLIDVLETRANLYQVQTMTPDLPERKADLLRGQHLEILTILKALKDIAAGDA